MKKVGFMLLLLSLSMSLYAQTRTVKLGMNIPKDEKTGRYCGYEYDYFQVIAKYTGWNYEYIAGTPEQYEQWLELGIVDIVADHYRIKNRDNLLESDYPVFDFTYYIFKKHCDTSISSDMLSTLNQKKIGVVQGSYEEKELENYKKKSNLNFIITRYEYPKLLKEAFYSEEDDLSLMCISDYSASQCSDLSMVNEVGKKSVGVLFSEKNKSVMREFNKAQAQLIKQRPYLMRNLKSKYYEFINPFEVDNKQRNYWVKTHDTLRIGYANTWFPFCMEANGKVIGLLPDYMDKIKELLNLQNMKIEYVPYSSFTDCIRDLKNKKIDVVFPAYGDFYEAELNGIQCSDIITEITLDLLYEASPDIESIENIILKNDYQIYRRYAILYLQQYHLENKDFSFAKGFEEILSEPNTAVIVNSIMADSVALASKNKFKKYELPDKCPIAFGVRREDIGLLNLLDTGINLINPNYVVNKINTLVFGTRQYNLWNVIEDNAIAVISIILSFVTIIIIILAIYIKTIQKNRLSLERSKEEVDKALLIAENANKAKSIFINNVSHDIRTPMNAIIGFADIANRNIENPEKVKDCLSKIQISSDHLLDLINDVLDMSKIESGKIVLEPKEENIISIAKDMQIILQSDIENKNLNFKLDYSNVNHPEVICDKLKLNQILLNILSNAIKFTPEKGTVSLVIKETGFTDEIACFTIVVEDNGVGMSKDFQKVVFEEFEREKNSTISKIPGTGLGMSITKKLVEMMNGNIEVESEENQGTKVTVALDFAINQNASTYEEKKNTVLTEEKRKELFMNKKILLVEDNELNQEIAKVILEDADFVVQIVNNGKEALEAIHNSNGTDYDLILMDIQMPVMNGLEATKAIRVLDDYKKANIPIIAMTANAFEEDKKETVEAGMNGYISKPIILEQLYQTLTDILLNSLSIKKVDL